MAEDIHSYLACYSNHTEIPILPPVRSIFLNRIIPVQTLTQINQSGLHIYWFILLNTVTQMAGFTSHISPEYVIYSPHSSTDHI